MKQSETLSLVVPPVINRATDRRRQHDQSKNARSAGRVRAANVGAYGHASIVPPEGTESAEPFHTVPRRRPRRDLPPTRTELSHIDTTNLE